MTDSDTTSGPAVRLSDTVELTVPADSAYVSLLRTVTASLAARRDFTLEDIDDLRIAVDEASALLLPHAAPESHLSASFSGAPTHLMVAVSVTATASTTVQAIDQTSFAWMVLAALADGIDTELSGGRLTITLSKSRDTRVL